MKKFKQTVAKIFKIGILTAMMGFTIYGAYRFGEVNVINVEATVIDSMPAKIEDLKNSVVERLVKCESAGLKESDAPIILDTNKKMSIGVLQFQVATVIHYVKVLESRDITKLEATLIALDADKAKSLAKSIIFETKSGVISDWFNCSNKGNLQSEVNLIKKLI